jgi:protein-tyrosine phosphatase
VPVNYVKAANILTYLNGATTFLHTMLQQQQGSVLVHCEQGMSRSSTVVMAYLMRYQGMTRDEAYVICKSKRPMVNPNEGLRQ